MNNMLRRFTGVLFGLLLLTTVAMAQQVNLVPYLQAERNEVALLTSQANCLQQAGDPLGAAVLASYIPDHQMMIVMLSNAIRQQGGNPDAVQVNITPQMGTREQVLAFDQQQHESALNQYRQLAQQTNDPNLDYLATLGQSGAARHLYSIQVARGVTNWTPQSVTQATLAALTLERTAIADLEAQANRLTALGDTATASTLTAMIPQHRQQAANLETMLTQLGGDPAQVMVPPVVPLQTRAEILAHLRTSDTQMINTYAVAINALPPSPLQQTMAQGQSLALTSLASLQQLLPVV